MADTKTTGLGELAETPAIDDLIPIVDVNDTTMSAEGTNKGIKYGNLIGPTLVVSSSNIQIDPTVHPNGCVFELENSSYDSPKQIKLPAIAAQPPPGTIYRVICTDPIGMYPGCTISNYGSSTSNFPSIYSSRYLYILMVYVGGNLWLSFVNGSPYSMHLSNDA